nr:MAG TPA: hypothetical protein [Caudoviricetes sp.]
MTDEVIIKNVRNSVYKNKPMLFGQKFLESVLDLINRQKAENERYKRVIRLLENDVQQAQSKAIRDFAKRLKSKVNDLEFRTKTHQKTVPTKFCDDNANWVMHECIPQEIDNLVKEMTEVQE